MTYSKLKIAWSVFCGLVAVLLLCLWVRSYWSWDTVAKGWGPTTQQVIAISSQSGALIVHYMDARGSTTIAFTRWKVTLLPSPDRDLLPVGGIEEANAGFLFVHDREGFMVSLPYWFFVPLTLAGGAIPWVGGSKQFTTRTLLIATTLIALMLGVIVWAAS